MVLEAARGGPIGEGSKLSRLAAVAGRGFRHACRAVAAANRIGPGRHPGMVTEVRVEDGGLFTRGHVHVPGDTFTSIVVTLNGATAAAVPLEDALGAPGTNRVVWSALIQSAGLPEGEIEVGAFAIGRSGLVEVLQPCRFDPGSAGSDGVGSKLPSGRFDHPVEASVQPGGVVELNGWAAPAMGVDRIELILDGRPAGLVRPFSSARGDVSASTGDERDVLCGFSHVLDLGARAVGSTCTVELDAVGQAGRTRLGSRTVVVGPRTRWAGGDEARWVSSLAGRVQMVADACVPGEGVNLAVVTHDLGVGGAQLWLQEILRPLLLRPDVSCTVITQTDGALRDELEGAGARVHVCGRFPDSGGVYESMMREIVQIVVSEGTNVILANTAAAFPGVDAALRCGLPSVYAIHDHFTPAVRSYYAYGLGLDEHVASRWRDCLDRADALGFVAEATRQLYCGEGGDDRSFTLGYGIDLESADTAMGKLDRQALRAQHGYQPADRVLACVAMLATRKCQASLVLAFSRIAESHPEAHLALVGAGDDSYSESVAELVAALGLARRVRLVPIAGDVAPWWVMADGSVLASDSESLPRSILEAFAFKVPVLATDVGGVGELVTDGVTGLLVPSRDVGALADGLRRLLETPRDGLAAMTARAAATRADLDAAGYAAAYERLLRGLVKDRGTPARALLASG